MRRVGRTKPENKNRLALKRTISAPAELFEQADAIVSSRMIATFSAYVQSLIREDLNRKKAA